VSEYEGMNLPDAIRIFERKKEEVNKI